jgi:predicted phosphate transport protein (TIGR00153 family)
MYNRENSVLAEILSGGITLVMPPTIAGLFGQSPIKPLQEHISTVTDCAQQLPAFIDAVIDNDWDLASKHYKSIVKAEHEADSKKKQIRRHLHKSLFLPIPREDLLGLLSKQDKIANTTKDIAGLMLGRKMTIPNELSESFRLFIESAIAATMATKDLINEIDELIETGFGGRQIDLIEKIIDRLEELESKNDEQQIQVRVQLHPLEDQLSPVETMFLYKIIDLIGNLADRAETIGDQIQVIIAK